MEGTIEIVEELPDRDIKVPDYLAEGNEEEPNVTGISVNPECTEFNVIFSGRELSLYENVLHMSLCIVGDRFQLYQGKQENELVTVMNYIDEDSGEIFNTINSRELK